MPGPQGHGGLRPRRGPGRPPITTDEPVALPEHELYARVYRTLADPTRLRILERLAEVGEVSQRELVDDLQVAQPRVSEHVSALVWCGLVEGRREGRVTHYRLAGVWASEFLELARHFIDEAPRAVGGCVPITRTEIAAGRAGRASATAAGATGASATRASATGAGAALAADTAAAREAADTAPADAEAADAGAADEDTGNGPPPRAQSG